MSLSAKEASEQVGLTKQGIIKAIHQGKISAQKDANGEWRIEPVELFRMYSPVNHSSQQPAATGFRQDMVEDATSLRKEIELLRERLTDKDEVIFDLRQRLDTEADERRKLTMLLTAERNAPAPPTNAQRFWRRLFRG